MDKPFNVLFITADQWRGECLSWLGHPCLKTPHLDALARDGVTFKRHFAQATPCGPSRASLYTGMYLQNHRAVVNGAPLDARHTNVALEARKAGYDPVLFGYTDIGADPRHFHPADPALRSYEGLLPGMTPQVWMKDNSLAWIAELKAKGYDIPRGEVFRPQADYPGADGRGPTFAPARYRAEDSNTAFLTDAAIKYISVRDHEPWFIHMSYLAPHPPFVVPEPYHAMYDPATVPPPVRASSPEAEGSQHPYLDYYLHHQQGSGISFGLTAAKHHLNLSESEVLQARATYYGMMSEVDAQIGRLVDALKASGEYERTLIVFTSDHGEHVGDHWQFAKYSYFEPTFYIPLIVREPSAAGDAARGSIVDEFTENVDVMPTILDQLSLEIPNQCDGESLLPFCHDRTPAHWRDSAFSECDFRDFIPEDSKTVLGLTPDQCTFNVLRDRRYKYVHMTGLPPLFFDLETDPQEFHNLAKDPGHQAKVLEFAQRMLSLRMNHDERVLANVMLTPKGPVERKTGRRHHES
ncbi:MAG: alkaline phosphatase family protein [Alphaproteobacteria bacterium]